MKKILILLFACSPILMQAKKVKFAVDMTGITVNSTGVHVTGDFQTLAGFPNGDWQSNTTPMFQELADTNIYSIVVDVPAFAKYEYKFLNGDQFYDVEFVPVESRVGYNFNDNRWLYVDSLVNDTTFVGAIRFSGNAPAGKNLIRFLVDMANETVSSNGVYISSTANDLAQVVDHLYNFDAAIWEGILYSSEPTVAYRFVNGNTLGNAELVPVSCGAEGLRLANPDTDLVLPVVCYAFCFDCLSTGLEDAHVNEIRVFPNPSQGETITIQSTKAMHGTVQIMDISGRTIYSASVENQFQCAVPTSLFSKGIYILSTPGIDGTMQQKKIQIN